MWLVSEPFHLYFFPQFSQAKSFFSSPRFDLVTVKFPDRAKSWSRLHRSANAAANEAPRNILVETRTNPHFGYEHKRKNDNLVIAFNFSYTEETRIKLETFGRLRMKHNDTNDYFYWGHKRQEIFAPFHQQINISITKWTGNNKITGLSKTK